MPFAPPGPLPDRARRYPGRRRAGALPSVVVLLGAFTAACCFPSAEQQQEILARQEARAVSEAATTAARAERVPAMRAHLTAIAGAERPAGERACDAATVDALRAGPPEGVDDTFWRYPWVVEEGWLNAASAAGVSRTPPPDPAIDGLVSLEVKVAFRAPSTEAWMAESDIQRWGEQMERRPPLLAVVSIDRLVEPVLVWGGVAFVDGSFSPGAAQGTVVLWDLVGERELCSTRFDAVSSADVKFGGIVIDTDAKTAVADDFEAQVRAALNAAADHLSPGLRLAI